MKFKPKTLKTLLQGSYLFAGSDGYTLSLHDALPIYKTNVSSAWRDYFDQLSKEGGPQDVSHQAVRAQFLKLARDRKRAIGGAAKAGLQNGQQERVTELIAAYRRLGHLKANIDPLGLYKGIDNPILDLSYYGFSKQDLEKIFHVELFTGLKQTTATLGEVYQTLQQIYCSTIGFEYMHINRSEEVEWIQQRIENNWPKITFTTEEKKRILERLIVADSLEKYLGARFVGQKRFSLEGGDSLIPLLDTIINHCAKDGIKEVIIGMAHRGRLNVLVNVVGKNPKEIFDAFEGKGISTTHSGDVKYHLGYSSNVNTPYGTIHIALAFNPSHLEIISPVAQGSVRARQRRRRDTPQKQVVPIQIHGDAAFAGQGVVMETFSMSQARWFTVGGSIHVVINNQVGFTISNPQDVRSTLYCTDVAKMVEAPILHVNASDPEAVCFAALFAIDYRQTFKRDVVIDLVCYRRHGHNEADEPSATQPGMYKVIKALQSPYTYYAKQLQEKGVIEAGSEKKIIDAYRDALDNGKAVVNVNTDQSVYEYLVSWEPFVGKDWMQNIKTAVPLQQIKKLANALERLPEGFVLQPQVKKILETQKQMTTGEIPMNWGYAETMAYATLLVENYPIRLCGQDSARGTFAHRHAVLHDFKTIEIYIPLSHLSEKQAQINVVDSLLSEEAVLAFEYGYATAEPNFLVLWEAQFGDFANGAQVVIDQFISSGEQKWGRLCGLVMLLPHGYEGQGPEHSSARLERYLQLCAQENIQVCVPSTPAQTSHLEELAQGDYQLVIPEIDSLDNKKISRVIFCCGKIYYDLLQSRRELKLDHVAIIRIEQLYPFPVADCKHIFETYSYVKEIIWCQEEPQNQGAFVFIDTYLSQLLMKGQILQYVGRLALASSAVGYHAVHEKEQHELVMRALK